MIGHEKIAAALSGMLREHGEWAADLIEHENGWPSGTIILPREENIFPTWVDIVSKGNYPTWMVIAQDTPLRRTVTQGPPEAFEEESDWLYPFMIATHVVGQDEFQTGMNRYRLMLVVRLILMSQKRLLKPNDRESAVIIPQDMQEVVGGMEQNRETRKYLMEGFNAFHVKTVEMTPSKFPDQGRFHGVDTAVQHTYDHHRIGSPQSE